MSRVDAPAIRAAFRERGFIADEAFGTALERVQMTFSDPTPIPPAETKPATAGATPAVGLPSGLRLPATGGGPQ